MNKISDNTKKEEEMYTHIIYIHMCIFLYIYITKWKRKTKEGTKNTKHKHQIVIKKKVRHKIWKNRKYYPPTMKLVRYF